ncbi:MAG: RNA polymerase sigma factor [Acidobacteria bacterium]|nr:RNA polymerase sigma factor [Acidobacteriota bacterium]
MWNESSPEEDRELIARCREGDPLAFEELVRKYQQPVLNLVYHYLGNRGDVEDVAQKIFIKIYFSLQKFDTRRPFFPWLYRIAINQCYDELRHIRRRKTYTFSELNLEDSASIEKILRSNEPAGQFDQDRSEMQALLQKVLSQLSDHQRKVIILRDIEAIPYIEMAAILKCTEQAARLKVFRARNKLKNILKKVLPESKSPRHD